MTMDADCYTKDMKIAEILDILRPPVSRTCRSPYQDCVGYVTTDSDETNRIHFAQTKFYENKSHQAVKSSLSLVLQKICKKQSLEQAPFGNKRWQQETQSTQTNTETKPTVKVTVIPRSYPNYLLQLIEAKHQTTQTIKKYYTRDNEQPTSAKNVYLVVAGKDKDKIYEIKTAGNNTFRDKPRDVKIDSERLSSKMEKKRKKSLNLEEDLDEKKCSDVECFCRCPREELDLSLEEEYPNGSSRVRLVGRVALDERNQYVMRCAATVNGLPVNTYVPPPRAAGTESHEHAPDARRDMKAERSTPVQFSFSNDQFVDPTSESTAPRALRAPHAAGVQPPRLGLRPTADRNTQCNLCELCTATEKIFNFNDESKVINLNRSTSPLVIISVYSKPELKTFATSTLDATPFQTFDIRNDRQNETLKVNNLAVKTDRTGGARDRSPDRARRSPCDPERDEATSIINENTKATITNMKKARSPSPGKKSLKSPNSKSPDGKKETQGRKNETDNKTAKVKPKLRSPSPNRNTSDKLTQKDANPSNHTKKVTKRTGVRKEQNEFQSYKSRAHSVSVNTDTGRQESPKTTKNTTAHKRNVPKHTMIKHDDSPPARRHNVLRKSLLMDEISKVSINIDSEKEFYDVVFKKRSASTDLVVTRTAKDNYSQYILEDNELTSDSLANFFPAPASGAQPRRSVSRDLVDRDDSVFPLATLTPRLNVRDSLDIGHRRDNAFKYYIKHVSDEENEDGGEYAPAKRWPGDACALHPGGRAGRGRALLGLSTERTHRTRADDALEHKVCRNNTISRSCLGHNTLCKSLSKKPTLHRPFIEKNQNIDNIYVPRRDEETSITDDEKHNLIKLGACTNINKQNINVQNKVNVAVMTHQQSTQYTDQSFLHLQSSNKEKISKPRQKVISLSRKQYRKVKKVIRKSNEHWKKGRHVWNSSVISVGSVQARRKSKSVYLVHYEYNKNVQTELLSKDLDKPKNVVRDDTNNRTVVLFCKEEEEINNYRTKDLNDIKKVGSSIEIRYTSIAYSAVDERGDVPCLPGAAWRTHDSIETIFRGHGHKRSFTPNLGTSSVSQVSREGKAGAGSLPAGKPRKPFLRRLMSCLVMQSESSAPRPGTRRTPAAASALDSYHVSTSLGAMDMSSSIYDTSVSFYSEHALGALNSTRRRFFSSVRGLLSARRN